MVPPTATDSAVTHDARGGAGAVAAAAGPWRAKRRCPRWRGRPLAAGLGLGPGRAEGTEGLFVALGAGLAAASHPLLYVKLLVQVRGRVGACGG